MRNWLVGLAAASGVCGIAYEVLYARAFTTWLGDMFHVGAAVLSAFLLGIALGARVAHRFARWLWLVEALIGAWAIVFALVSAPLFARFAASGGLAWTARPALAVAFVLVALLPPGLLVGFSVPLFSLWVEDSGAERSPAFALVYRAYNVAAAVFVLLVELVLLDALGLRVSLLSLGGVNVAIAALLFARVRRAPAPTPREERGPAPSRRAVLVLFALGAASGLFQLYFLKVAERLFGPYRESFAFVVALGLLGIGAGTWVVARSRVSFPRVALACTVLAGLAVVCVLPLVYARAAITPTLATNGWAMRGGKLLLLATLGGPALAAFGATVPALLRERPASRRTAGDLLFVAGLGNVAGYLAAATGLYAWLSAPGLAAASCLLAAAGAAALAPTAGRARALALAGVGWSVVVALAWPGHVMSLPHESTSSLAKLQATRAAAGVLEEHRRFDSSVYVGPVGDGTALLINGYTSLLHDRQGGTWLRETLFGASPARFAARRERALVLGLGAGFSANGTAAYFQQTRVVEINPILVELLPRWSADNGDLATRADVQVVVQDGLSALYNDEERYDAIVNTVTSPLFFSSSKLYTADFFELARSRLRDGGVYALWFDGRIKSDGMRILFETVKSVFDDCAVVSLATSYVQLICSDEPLVARPIGAPRPEVGDRLAELFPGVALPDLIDAYTFPRHALLTVDWGVPRNTYDRPTLERAIASTGGFVTAEDPYALLRVDLTHGPMGRLTGDELAARCARLRFVEALFPPCLAVLRGQHRGRLPPRFFAVLLEERVPLAAPERAALVQEAVAAKERAVADELLRRTPPEQRDELPILFVTARLQLRDRGDVDDDLLRRLEQRGADDPLTRGLIMQVRQSRRARTP